MNEKYEYQVYHQISNKYGYDSGWIYDGVYRADTVEKTIERKRTCAAGSNCTIEFRIERREVTPWFEVSLDEVMKDAQKKGENNG